MHEYLVDNLRILEQESVGKDGRMEVKAASDEGEEESAEPSFQAIEDEVLKLMSGLSLR